MKQFFPSIFAACIGAGVFCIMFYLQSMILKIQPVVIGFIIPSSLGAVSGLLIHFFKTKWEKEAIQREKGKLETFKEITGAVCHEMNQPLQAILGNLEILLMNLPKDNPSFRHLKNIQEQTEKMGVITKKMIRIKDYQTKDYLSSKIVDIDNSSKRP